MNKTKIYVGFAIFAAMLMLITPCIARPTAEKTNMDAIEQTYDTAYLSKKEAMISAQESLKEGILSLDKNTNSVAKTISICVYAQGNSIIASMGTTNNGMPETECEGLLLMIKMYTLGLGALTYACSQGDLTACVIAAFYAAAIAIMQAIYDKECTDNDGEPNYTLSTNIILDDCGCSQQSTPVQPLP